MARNTVTKTVDDIDGREGAQGHSFALDGVGYEIDLHPENFGEFYDGLAKYIESARRISRGRPSDPRSSLVRTGPRSSPAANRPIRDWWKDQADRGRSDLPPCNDRGRIPEVVLAAYRAEVDSTDEAFPAPRSRSKHPGTDEVQKVFDLVGSAKGVADHFGVSYPTALAWVRALSE